MILRYVGMIMLLMSVASPKHKWQNIGKVKALSIDFYFENPDPNKEYFSESINVKMWGNRLTIRGTRNNEISTLVIIDEKDRANDSSSTINHKDKSFIQISKREMNGIFIMAEVALEIGLKGLEKDKKVNMNFEDFKFNLQIKDLKKEEKIAGYSFQGHSYGVLDQHPLEVFSSKDFEKLVKEHFNHEISSLYSEGFEWAIFPELEKAFSVLSDYWNQISKHGFIGKVVIEGRTLMTVTKVEVVEIDESEFSIPSGFTKKIIPDYVIEKIVNEANKKIW